MFCPSKFNEVAIELEECSRELAKIAFARDTTVPSVITKTEFKRITKTDKYEWDYCVFEDDLSARNWANDSDIGLGRNMKADKGKAPKELCKDGKNPTLDYLLSRKSGINDKSWVRKVRLDTNNICVYWKKGPCPSTYTKPESIQSKSIQ